MLKELNLYHYFSDTMNLYGDRGNPLILKMRAEWRGIKLNIHEVNDITKYPISNADILFIGGGSDREQGLIMESLFAVKGDMKAAFDDGVCGLMICGGYQFLGNYYELPDGEQLKGLDILDFYTKSHSIDPKKRLIGDIQVYSETFGRVVGYENHSGQTFHNYDTLGTVVSGYGNNKKDKQEGLVYNNLIGTYLHGPLLSKNPRIADWILQKALERKYGDTTLEPLNDMFELKGNKNIWTRCIN